MTLEEKAMYPTLTIRPDFDVKRLKKLVTEKLHYKNVNQFVSQAILEKAQREAGSESGEERVIADIRQVLMKYKGWTFYKPNPKEEAEIRKSQAAVKSGKMKTYTSEEVLKKLRS